MKIRVYYGETNGYDYVTFVLGNMFITYADIINDIDIRRENIPKIVDSIDFDGWDWSDFLDVYGIISMITTASQPVDY